MNDKPTLEILEKKVVQNPVTDTNIIFYKWKLPNGESYWGDIGLLNDDLKLAEMYGGQIIGEELI